MALVMTTVTRGVSLERSGGQIKRRERALNICCHGTRKWLAKRLVVTVGILVSLQVAVSTALAQSSSGTPSRNVVIIGGTTLDSNIPCANGGLPTAANVMSFTSGGCLPVTGLVGEL